MACLLVSSSTVEGISADALSLIGPTASNRHNLSEAANTILRSLRGGWATPDEKLPEAISQPKEARRHSEPLIIGEREVEELRQLEEQANLKQEERKQSKSKGKRTESKEKVAVQADEAVQKEEGIPAGAQSQEPPQSPAISEAKAVTTFHRSLTEVLLATIEAEAAEAAEETSAEVKPVLKAQLSPATWRRSDNVMLLLDWDDTLLPSTWMMSKSWFRRWVRDEAAGRDVLQMADVDRLKLAELDVIACDFLWAASHSGRVCCVTLARRPWQERSMRAFMPKLAELWKELNVEVHYASEFYVETPSRHGAWCQRPCEATQLEQVIHELQIRCDQKRRAMKRVLNRFYRDTDSWCNVVSIGDGPAERFALQELAFHWRQPRNAEQRFRVKTIQLLEEPDIDHLQVQLQVLQAWIPAVVSLDQDFDTSFGSAEGAILEAHKNLLRYAEAGSCEAPGTFRKNRISMPESRT